MMIHSWQIIGRDFARPHVLAESQPEKDGSLACGQSQQGLSLIFQFWIQLQKGSLSKQRHMSITCKKHCVFPAQAPVTHNISLLPTCTIISVLWGTYSSRIHVNCTPWHFHMRHQILQTVQDSDCSAVLCLVRTYLLLVPSELAAALIQGNSVLVCLSIQKGMTSNLPVFLPLELTWSSTESKDYLPNTLSMFTTMKYNARATQRVPLRAEMWHMCMIFSRV